MLLTANAEKVRFEQLPIELKDKIRVHSGAAQIEDVDRKTTGGNTVYEVGFKKDGRHTELRFDDKGTLLTDGAEPALDSRKISYSELPESIRKSLQARVKEGEINDIDRQVKNGQATYEIGYKQNGQQQELVLSDDGRILNDSVAVGAPAAPVSGRSSVTTTSSGENQVLPQAVTLSASEKVTLKQLPTEVQRAINTAAAGARIEDIERGIYQGQNVYQAAFKERGQHVEIQVRENGTVLHDPRAVGASAPRVRGSATSANARPAEYATITSLVPLSSGSKVERSALPTAVDRRLRFTIGNDKIEDIERGTWNGKTIYQVAFKDQAGKHVELQIDERGQIVYDPRSK
ncbi:MAG TPA: PepSY-like domain-containing protein [Verrucomicrobiae bacterium]